MLYVYILCTLLWISSRKKKGKMYIFPQNKIFTLFCILLRKSNKNNNIPIKKKKVSKVKLLSPVWLFATPWTVAYQAPLSMEFSRQEYWSGLPFPSPGDLPDPGIEPRSPALQADALTSEPPGKPWLWMLYISPSPSDSHPLFQSHLHHFKLRPSQTSHCHQHTPCILMPL